MLFSQQVLTGFASLQNYKKYLTFANELLVSFFSRKTFTERIFLSRLKLKIIINAYLKKMQGYLRYTGHSQNVQYTFWSNINRVAQKSVCRFAFKVLNTKYVRNHVLL